MALDVMRNPTYSVTLLRWYKPSETTPFALCGHIGPVLAQLAPENYGDSVRELWFGDEGWTHIDGQEFDEADMIAFAIPGAPSAEQDAALAEVAINAASNCCTYPNCDCEEPEDHGCNRTSPIAGTSLSAAKVREQFEEWARDAAGLDIHHADSDSPLDRARYASFVTATAWDAWVTARALLRNG